MHEEKKKLSFIDLIHAAYAGYTKRPGIFVVYEDDIESAVPMLLGTTGKHLWGELGDNARYTNRWLVPFGERDLVIDVISGSREQPEQVQPVASEESSDVQEPAESWPARCALAVLENQKLTEKIKSLTQELEASQQRYDKFVREIPEKYHEVCDEVRTLRVIADSCKHWKHEESVLRQGLKGAKQLYDELLKQFNEKCHEFRETTKAQGAIVDQHKHALAESQKLVCALLARCGGTGKLKNRECPKRGQPAAPDPLRLSHLDRRVTLTTLTVGEGRFVGMYTFTMGGSAELLLSLSADQVREAAAWFQQVAQCLEYESSENLKCTSPEPK